MPGIALLATVAGAFDTYALLTKRETICAAIRRATRDHPAQVVAIAVAFAVHLVDGARR